MALAHWMEPSREPEPAPAWRRPIADLNAPIAPNGLESNEPQMETLQHLHALLDLLEPLEWLWRDRHDFFAAGNLTIYFSPHQLKSEDFRGPDFFIVLDTHREPPRKSWVVWDEGGKYPNVIVEALSDSTQKVDRGLKKQIYQDVFRTPEYFLFDPETGQLDGYRLDAGRYQPIRPDPEGRLASQQVDLLVGVREGRLRWHLPGGDLVPSGIERGLEAEAEAKRAETEAKRAETEAKRAETEAKRAETEAKRAETEAKRAETEAKRAEVAEQRVEELMKKLRAMGIDPDALK